jgi:hypothetical protein
MEAKEKRIELHKKLRNLSPIRRAEENERLKFLSGSKENKEIRKHESIDRMKKNKKNFNSKKNGSNNNENGKINLSKNINEYRHILTSRQPDDAELKWVLKLRSYIGIPNFPKLEELKKQSLTKAYYRDIDAYKEKVKKGKRAELKTAQPNLNELRHLYKTRMDGTTNIYQFNYESSLRNFFPKDLNEKEKWRNISDTEKPRLFSSYYSNNRNSLSPINKNYKGPDTVLRAYETLNDVKLFLYFE